MSVRMRVFITRCFYSLSSQKDVSLACYRIMSVEVLDHEVTVAESSTVFGAQAAKLRGPKLEVRQASICKSPRAAERN